MLELATKEDLEKVFEEIKKLKDWKLHISCKYCNGEGYKETVGHNRDIDKCDLCYGTGLKPDIIQTIIKKAKI